MSLLVRNCRFFVIFLSFFTFLSAEAYASLWRILPGETIPYLVKRRSATVVSSDIARLDPGTMVVVTYLTGGTETFRCIEYVTEFQYELLRSACFVAVLPPEGEGAE